MALQKLQQPSNLASIIQNVPGLVGLFKGGSSAQTDSGGTTTTQTNLSQAGLDDVLRQILEGNQGLASVARGQKTAGLYNSTVNTQLINDLITKAAGQVAQINAPKTTTTTPVTRTTKAQAPLDLGSTLATVGSLVAANKIAKSDTVKKALEGIFGGSGGDLGTGISATAGGITGITAGGLSSGGMGLDLGSGIGSSGTFSGGDVLTSLFNIGTSSDKGQALEQSAGAAIGNALFPGVGGFVGGALGPTVIGGAEDALSSVADVGSNLVEGAGDLVSNVVSGLTGGCYITTATCKLMNKPDDCDELTTLRAFRDSWMKDNHPDEIQAYYDIAPTILERISHLPDANELFSNIYTLYILPSVQAIKAGLNEEAYSIYKTMVLALSKLAPTSTTAQE